MLVGILKIFLHAALVSFDEGNTLLPLIQQAGTSPFKKRDVSESKSETSKSSQLTPKFAKSENSAPQQPEKSIQVEDLPRLINQMKPMATQLLFQTVNLPDLIRKLLQIVSSVIGNPSLSSDHSELVCHCFDLMLPFLLHQGELMHALASCEQIESILQIALGVKDENVRQAAERLFSGVCKDQNLRKFVLQALLKQLNKTCEGSKEFFNLLVVAIR